MAASARGPRIGELHQVRAEVAPCEVVATGGVAHDPERVGDLDVVAGVTGSAVVVDVEGEPELAGVSEHELAVGVLSWAWVPSQS
jgi:hypothetical protein